MENNLTVPLEVTHIVIIQTRSSTPRYLPKRVEKICPCKYLYMNVHFNSFHNNQKVETTQMGYPYNGILFDHIKEWNMINTMRHKWTSKSVCLMKRARLCIIWIQLYEISGIGKSIETKITFVASRAWVYEEMWNGC